MGWDGRSLGFRGRFDEGDHEVGLEAGPLRSSEGVDRVPQEYGTLPGEESGVSTVEVNFETRPSRVRAGADRAVDALWGPRKSTASTFRDVARHRRRPVPGAAEVLAAASFRN